MFVLSEGLNVRGHCNGYHEFGFGEQLYKNYGYAGQMAE